MTRSASLERKSLDTRAADALRERIMRGSFAPGDRLTEEALAERLTISRGTIRSALQKLAFEGLVEQMPYRGWMVPRLTPQDAWELYTLRSSLEGLAARLVAEKVTSEKTTRLQAALRKLSDAARAGSRTAVALADFEFHKTVIRLAEHDRLAHQYALVEHQVRVYIASCDALLPTLEEIARQHEPIVEAICRGEVEAAEHLSHAHNTVDGEALVRQLQSLDVEERAAARPAGARRALHPPRRKTRSGAMLPR